VDLLLIDNYDSFTYNLYDLFAALGADVAVFRNDELTPAQAARLKPRRLVLSPGPGRPADAGYLKAIIERLAKKVPTLGVCLGHQAIVEVFGGEVGYAHELVHGKARPVHHAGQGIFRGLADPFEAGRYHSLAATRLPDCLEVTAWAADEEVMAVRHHQLAIEGVQFHPESILTPAGPQLAANFIEAS
jgi:anthranilate synthase/aminodeoxychorismate synthase-like glutamine amidotransferase